MPHKKPNQSRHRFSLRDSIPLTTRHWDRVFKAGAGATAVQPRGDRDGTDPSDHFPAERPNARQRIHHNPQRRKDMTTVSPPSSVGDAIQQLQKVFDEAIKTNLEITTIKTKKQNIQNVVSQRPQQ